ncbi:MAG: hypothetical protein ABRQ37_10845 [Candidatus Eremiobacterota bacterium]
MKYTIIMNNEQKYRNNILELKKVKDEIISFFDKNSKKKNIYISEVNRLYHNIFTVRELISIDKPGNYRNSIKHCLDEAKYAFEMISESLNRFDEIDGKKQELKLREIFYLCYDEFLLLLNNLAPPEIYSMAVKISDREYHIPCSVCGIIAFVFSVEIPRFEEHENLICTGITHRRAIGLEHREKIFSLLEDRKIREIHDFFIKFISHEGIDAYCPLCDKIYCRIHYNAWEQYDDGFYDCTYGTCPEGHKRMIDD